MQPGYGLLATRVRRGGHVPALQNCSQGSANRPAREGDNHRPAKDDVPLCREEEQISEADRDLGQANSNSEHDNPRDSDLGVSAES